MPDQSGDAAGPASQNGAEAPIASVLIMVAMDAEAAPIIEALGLASNDIELCAPFPSLPSLYCAPPALRVERGGVGPDAGSAPPTSTHQHSSGGVFVR